VTVGNNTKYFAVEVELATEDSPVNLAGNETLKAFINQFIGLPENDPNVLFGFSINFDAAESLPETYSPFHSTLQYVTLFRELSLITKPPSKEVHVVE
jgi:hypothetical protein